VERFPAVRRALLTDRPIWQGVALTALAVAIPTGARLVIDQGQGGILFVTYFPAILLVAIFLDWQFGAATAFFSGAAANRLLRPDPVLFYDSPRDFLMVALYALTCAFLIWMGAMLRRVIRELEQARQQEEQLNRELLHRARNTLGIVGALASMTARHSPPEHFIDAFNGRISALRRATDLIEQDESLRDAQTLVERALAPFRTEDNFRIEGPSADIPQDTCVPLVLMLHELCTNAAKHGALSVPEGRVALAWHCDEAGLLTIEWREEGGPPVPEVRRTGMGTQLLRRQRGLTSVEADFRPEGLRCTIVIDGATPHAAPAERAA
jgi:two-component sensor histidine kinase